jgi:hypothetical protein
MTTDTIKSKVKSQMSKKTHTTNSRTFLREFKDLKGKLYSGEVLVIEIPDKKENRTIEVRVKESEKSRAMKKACEILRSKGKRKRIKKVDLFSFENVFPRLT